MTELKLVRIDSWRPLNHKLMTEYLDACKQKQSAVCCEWFSFLTENETAIMCKAKRDGLLSALKKRYRKANLSLNERNEIRRRFNEWQRLFRKYEEEFLRFRMAFCLNLITEEVLCNLAGRNSKRLYDFEQKHFFCLRGAILRNAAL